MSKEQTNFTTSTLHPPVRVPHRLVSQRESTPTRVETTPNRYSRPERTLTSIEGRRHEPAGCWRSVSAERSRSENMQRVRESLDALDQMFSQGPRQKRIVLQQLEKAFTGLQQLANADGCNLHPSTERLMIRYFARLSQVGGDQSLQITSAELSPLSQVSVARTDGSRRVYQSRAGGIIHSDQIPVAR